MQMQWDKKRLSGGLKLSTAIHRLSTSMASVFVHMYLKAGIFGDLLKSLILFFKYWVEDCHLFFWIFFDVVLCNVVYFSYLKIVLLEETLIFHGNIFLWLKIRKTVYIKKEKSKEVKIQKILTKPSSIWNRIFKIKFQAQAGDCYITPIFVVDIFGNNGWVCLMGLLARMRYCSLFLVLSPLLQTFFCDLVNPLLEAHVAVVETYNCELW